MLELEEGDESGSDEVQRHKMSKIAEKVFKYKSIAKIVRVEVGRNLG